MSQVRCIIPAKGHSTRFPRKNVALLKGRPLLGYAIDAAINSSVFDRVEVSTEDEQIGEMAELYGATWRRRDPALSQSEVGIVTVVRATVQEWGADVPPFIGIILSTAALITAEEVQGCWDLLQREEKRGALGVMTVVRPMEHPLGALQLGPGDTFLHLCFPEVVHGPGPWPDLWVDAGAVYLYRTHSFLEHGFYPPAGLLPYPISRLRSVDVNYPEDLDLMERIIQRDWS